MKLFLCLCLLFSSVSPAVLQTCRKCENFHGTECTENEKERCPFYFKSCQSLVIKGNLLKFFPKASYSCDFCEAGDYGFTTGANGSFNMAVRCCKSDQCNAKPLEIPSEPMEPNGRECTGCYAEGEEDCKGVEVVSCSGTQTKCMKMKMEIRDYIDYGESNVFYTSARGCATPDMCRLEELPENLVVRRKTVTFNVECSKAL